MIISNPPAAGDWLNTEKSETNDAELGCWAGNPGILDIKLGLNLDSIFVKVLPVLGPIVLFTLH